MTVQFRARGRDRRGEIVKVGRSRVTVRYRITTGAERSVVLYARDVRPT